jgi:hypothetical protein
VRAAVQVVAPYRHGRITFSAEVRSKEADNNPDDNASEQTTSVVSPR